MRHMPLLREQVVFLEVSDARCVGLDPKRYLAAARSVRTIISRDLGGLAMQAFQRPGAPALQTIAENIYFDTYGRFADLDGSGHADTAQLLADQMIRRARSGARQV